MYSLIEFADTTVNYPIAGMTSLTTFHLKLDVNSFLLTQQQQQHDVREFSKITSYPRVKFIIEGRAMTAKIYFDI